MKKLIFLCLLSFCVKSQTQTIYRFTEKPNIATIYTQNPLSIFSVADGDISKVGILADVLKHKKAYSIYMFVDLDKNITNCALYLTFFNGMEYKLLPQLVQVDVNYLEYRLPNELVNVLKDTPVKGINISTKDYFMPCEDIRNNNFFINFLALVN